MDRLVQRNVLATSGRAVEAAGDVTTLLLDKTGTITHGNRRATEFVALAGVKEDDLVRAAAWASRADPTPEGASIVELADHAGAALAEDGGPDAPSGTSVPFSAATRMSGVDLDDGTSIRKGAGSAISAWLGAEGRGRVLGVVHLKDIVKEGLSERFAELCAMGIRTVMITGDNPLTARAIGREAGVDDVLAEATPEDKLRLIRREQEGGNLVAMTGDGTNDAPALAQADVGVAMNSGTSAAKEAGNMVDLDSDPTKLIDVVRIGKQLLITRGAHRRRRRRGEVLRPHPGHVHGSVSQPGRAQRHGTAFPRIRGDVRRHLQRAHHHRPDPARPARRVLPLRIGLASAGSQPRHLRRGRNRRPVHRDLADRPAGPPDSRLLSPHGTDERNRRPS
jgi:high-affinity K+ transport system ATPase subunit B